MRPGYATEIMSDESRESLTISVVF